MTLNPNLPCEVVQAKPIPLILGAHVRAGFGWTHVNQVFGHRPIAWYALPTPTLISFVYLYTQL